MTFTVPDGWGKQGSDDFGVFLVSPGGDTINLYWDAYPGTVDGGASCGLPSVSMDEVWAADWSVPHSAQDLVNSLVSRPNWSGSTAPVSIGGLDGWRMDGVLGDVGCPYLYSLPLSSTPLYLRGVGVNHLYALDDRDGHTVLISNNHVSSLATEDQFLAEAKTVIDSFVFARQEPTPEPTEAPPPSPPATPAGTYGTHHFKPVLTFTIPDGWTFDDSDERLRMAEVSETDSAIEVAWDVYPVNTFRCTEPIDVKDRSDWSARHTAQDFVNYLTNRSDWSGSTKPTTLGGKTGWLLQGSLDEEATCGLLWSARSRYGYPSFGDAGGADRLSLYVLDDGSAGTIVAKVAGTASFRDDAEQVLASFAFEGADAPCAGASPSPMPAPTASAEGQFELIDYKYWSVPDSGYRYIVRFVNRGPAITAELGVTFFDACGQVLEDSVSLGSVEEAASASVVHHIAEGFVPVRMDVRFSSVP